MNGFLAITYAFMLAYCPCYNVGTGYESYTGCADEMNSNLTYASFQLGIKLFNCLDIYAGEETYQKKDGTIFNWKPLTQAYLIGAEYTKEINEKFILKTGIRHACQHPVDSWGEQESVYNMAYTKIYVAVEGKIDIF